MCVPWESNSQPFVLLTQCSTTEPHKNSYFITPSREVCFTHRHKTFKKCYVRLRLKTQKALFPQHNLCWPTHLKWTQEISWPIRVLWCRLSHRASQSGLTEHLSFKTGCWGESSENTQSQNHQRVWQALVHLHRDGSSKWFILTLMPPSMGIPCSVWMSLLNSPVHLHFESYQGLLAGQPNSVGTREYSLQ